MNAEMSVIRDRLGALRSEFEALEQNLDEDMSLVADCYEAYKRAPDSLRRMNNQAFFTRIRIWREEWAEGELAEPFATVSSIAQTRSGAASEEDAPLESGSYKVTCSKETDLVDLLHAYSKHLGKPNEAAELASTIARHTFDSEARATTSWSRDR